MFGRIGVILQSWLNALLGKAENPPLILDLAYEEFLTQLSDVKRGVADVATAKVQTRKQVEKVRQEIAKLEEQAIGELRDGNEDLARRLLQRKGQAEVRLQEFEAELQGLEEKQASLEQNAQNLEDQIDTFGKQKEVKKAQFRSSKAQARIGETMTGINRTGAALNRALGRMEGEQEALDARAEAIPELVAHGTLTDVTNRGKSALEREAEASQIERKANSELEAMRERLGLPAPKKVISPVPSDRQS